MIAVVGGDMQGLGAVTGSMFPVDGCPTYVLYFSFCDAMEAALVDFLALFWLLGAAGFGIG